jgi:ubiquitin
MKYIYIVLLALLVSPVATRAQEMYKGEISFSGVQAKKVKDKVTLDFTIDLQDVKMSSQAMIMLTPVIRSLDNERVHIFDPILVTGSARDKALKRALAFRYFKFDTEPQTWVRHHNGRPENVHVQLELPYSPWIRESKLMLHEVVSGCGECEIGQEDLDVMQQTLPAVYEPNYKTSLIYPPVEPVKRRSDTYVARLDFVVAKSELLYNFRNNAATLERADEFFTDILSDPNLTIGTCVVQGFASPDGNYGSNMTLSEARVNTFMNYLKNKYHIPAESFQVKWFGEDWDGLLKLLAPLSFKDKEELINIIHGEQDITLRKERVKALSNGETYQYLLDELFPILRRSEYTVNYIARPFNIAEAKTVINRKPCHLSLNEMYLVAHTYEKGSDAFNEVFQIAVEAFPDAAIARINAGAVEITQQRFDAAISHLLFVDQVEAWNNLAIAYSHVKNFEQALVYFERAVKAGSKEAEHNLQELHKLMDDYLY